MAADSSPAATPSSARTAALRERHAGFWAQAAPGWIHQADRHDALGRPLGAVALDWLAARPGERVVDLGCGVGGTTAELAAAVGATDAAPGPGGAAVGLDVAAAMVRAAQERFPASRHPGLRFEVADLDAIDELPGAPYDAAYSRATLMLLADPVAALAAVRRSLRPGGRFAATVFRDAAANPWLPAALLGAAPHVGALPPLPIGDEPGPFAFADPARPAAVLAAAGFVAVTVTPHNDFLTAPDDADLVAEWLIELGPAGAAYRAASADGRAAARSGTATLLARHRQPGVGYRLPVGLHLLTATAPVTRTG